MSFFISRVGLSPTTPIFFKICRNFSTKMQASSTSKTKDSAGRRLGVKKFGGEEVFPNDIVIRQRGFKWRPGKNTISGLDHTIHSRVEVRKFPTKTRFNNLNSREKSNLKSNIRRDIKRLPFI